MSIGTFFTEGLPDLVEQIGGLAGNVAGVSDKIMDARDAIKGDSRPETVAPIDVVKDTQGPISVISQYIPSNTIMVVGGVALATLVVMIILKKKG